MKDEEKTTSEESDPTQKIKRLLDQQLAINQLTLALGELNDLDSIYKKIHESVSGFMDNRTFIVASYRNSDQLIRAGYANVEGKLMDVSKFPPIPLEDEGKGTQSVVIRSKKPYYIPNVGEVLVETKTSYTIKDGEEIVEGAPPIDKEDSVSSQLLVPMMFDGEVHGVMQVQSYRYDAYSQEDIDILCSLANVSALILQNVFYKNNLEILVEERTQELRDTQEQIIVDERLVTLGKMSRDIGHELRTPLTAIKNAVYILRSTTQDSGTENAEMLEILETEIRSIEVFLEGVIDFSDPPGTVIRNVEINELLESTLKKIPVPLEVKVEWHLTKKIPSIFLDPKQASKVFINIFSNAVQAMPNGGQLKISTTKISEKWVTASFSDTGIGISEENMPKIFEPLFTTKPKSIGLGLAVAKTLIEMQGGRIEVKSELGKGSTFTIFLPVVHISEVHQ
ncbi:MAG: GAF domain-containing sensor histidine kinase [Candidatus Thorarchaeota archaeon]